MSEEAAEGFDLITACSHVSAGRKVEYLSEDGKWREWGMVGGSYITVNTLASMSARRFRLQPPKPWVKEAIDRWHSVSPPRGVEPLVQETVEKTVAEFRAELVHTELPVLRIQDMVTAVRERMLGKGK